MDEKTIFVEGRPDWKSEYGGITKNLPSIAATLQLITPYVDLEGKPLTILDFGCAYGYYLQTLKLINPSHVLYGIDAAADAVEYARHTLEPGKILWQTCGDRVPLQENSVDLILCLEMVEHVPGDEMLINMFRECRRLLKDDGYMFLTTPNCNFQQRLVFALSGRKWIFTSPDHPNVFNERKLRKLIAHHMRVHKVLYSYHGHFSQGIARSLPMRLLHVLRIAPSLVFVLRKPSVSNA